MNKHPRGRGHTSRSTLSRAGHTPALIGLAAALILAVTAAAFVMWWNEESAPELPGTPRLSVDREVIDLGRVPFRVPVHAVFKLTNTGGGVLRLGQWSRVDVLSGC